MAILNATRQLLMCSSSLLNHLRNPRLQLMVRKLLQKKDKRKAKKSRILLLCCPNFNSTSTLTLSS